MEVKSVYMDLNEWVKRGNVWRLESEAFKKPIEIKIWFENKELDEFNTRCSAIEDRLQRHDTDVQNLYMNDKENMMSHIKIEDALKEKQLQLDEFKKQLEEERSERKELLKEVATLKTMAEMQTGTILKLQEQVKELEKKVTKQPSVFHDKCFISGHESSGLWMFNLPDGDYLMIMMTKVWEHNEYVINEDELFMDKIHVEGQHYVPFYKLEWGTELDTPTATIYYDLVFIPC